MALCRRSPVRSLADPPLDGRGSVYLLQRVDAAICPQRDRTRMEWREHFSHCWATFMYIMCVYIDRALLPPPKKRDLRFLFSINFAIEKQIRVLFIYSKL